MDILRVVITIGVGALIGYCTNYIAIKMLFRPKKEVRVFGKRLPFTPGIIPKNQPRIAKAVGTAVGSNLLTNEDILQVLQSDKIKGGFVESVSGVLFSREDTIQECILSWNPELDMDQVKQNVSKKIAGQLVDSLKKIDFSELFGKIAVEAFADFRKNPMIAMFLNDSMIASIASKVAEYATTYLDKNGEEAITPLIEEKVSEMMENNIGDTLEDWNITQHVVEGCLGKLFDTFVEKKGSSLLEKVDIAGIVEEKINGMDVSELEDLVMSVMKQELQAVINLGAIIGALIGLLNLIPTL